jgi:methylenetetrahydrofolate dehydrogenase (NADP+)/methenyltetrahydrofolate cyclohydrolase
VTAQIIDGRKIAAELEETVADEIRALPGGRMRGGLATVAVGENFGAAAYQRRLERIAARMGVRYRHHQLSADSTEDHVLAAIARLDADPTVAGVLLLRPMPAQVRESAAFATLAPAKDIEAVHPENAGLLAIGTPRYVPSTAASAFHVLDTWLDQQGEDRAAFYENARIVVVGRSNNVGKPAVSLAYERRAAVTSIDEWSARGSRLGFHTRRADVLIVAAGVPGLIRAEHVRAGAVVLDIGINAITDPDTGKVRIVGDVVFPEVVSQARAITPVPGGIGPVTDVWLIHTVVLAERRRIEGTTR